MLEDNLEVPFQTEMLGVEVTVERIDMSGDEQIVAVEVRLVKVTGIGSGIILTSNGYILTNRHVVEGSTTLSVELEDGEVFPATLVQQSDTSDLALVKIEATGLAASAPD